MSESMQIATMCEEIERSLRRSDDVASIEAQADTSMLVTTQTYGPDDEPTVFRVTVEYA